MTADPVAVRVDKWLWAARFFKSRSLATEAVDGGHVRLNGERPKPSKDVRVGDRIEVRAGQFTFHVEVTGLSERRGSATIAAGLYRETEDSRQTRAAVAEQMRANALANPFKGRPTKKARRQIIRFVEPRGDGE